MTPPITLQDITAVETGLIGENRQRQLGQSIITTEQQLHECLGLGNPLTERTESIKDARARILDELRALGWDVKATQKVPRADKRIGAYNVALFFKPQAILMAQASGGKLDNPSMKNARSLHVDMRGLTGEKLSTQVETWMESVSAPDSNLAENIANFGGKKAKPFTSTDNDGKPGIDPEHRKGNEDCGCKKCKTKKEELEEATDIGKATLMKFKPGDQIKIEADWLKKPRIVTVQSKPKKVTTQSGSEYIEMYVASGKVRPGHHTGGLVSYNFWGDDKLVYQPTIQQKMRHVKRITRVAGIQTESSNLLDDLVELTEG